MCNEVGSGHWYWALWTGWPVVVNDEAMHAGGIRALRKRGFVSFLLLGFLKEWFLSAVVMVVTADDGKCLYLGSAKKKRTILSLLPIDCHCYR